MRIPKVILKVSIIVLGLVPVLFGWAGTVSAQDFDKTRAVEVAKVVLLQAQSLSFSHDVEFCGYITLIADGQMVATDPVAGSVLSCRIEEGPALGSIIASYHTHGSYNPLIDSEIPSSFDIVDDLAHERNGFVSTPGGRFWFIRSARGSAELLCGVGCLLMDDDFDRNGTDLVEHQYSLENLFAGLCSSHPRLLDIAFTPCQLKQSHTTSSRHGHQLHSPVCLNVRENKYVKDVWAMLVCSHSYEL